MASHNQWLTNCRQCGERTSRSYARQHNGQCKACAEPNAPQRTAARIDNEPTREQRMLDYGYQNYAREEGWYD